MSRNPPAKIMSERISVFPNLDLVLIGTVEWAMAKYRKEASDDEIIRQWAVDCPDIETAKYLKLVEERPQLKVK